jgi:SPP1 family holin
MKVKAETVIRTVVALVALINAILVMFGKKTLPFTDEDIRQVISGFFLIASTLWAWWKNNSFTPEAIKADEYLEELRGEE